MSDKARTIFKDIEAGRPYLKVPNDAIQNPSLSWKARGLLAFLLSLPDDWQVVKQTLEAQSKKDGRESTHSAFRELEEAGYIEWQEIPATCKQPPGKKYTVYNSAITENPQRVSRLRATRNGLAVDGLPAAGNPSTTYNTETKETETKETLQTKKKKGQFSLVDSQMQYKSRNEHRHSGIILNRPSHNMNNNKK